MKEDGYPNSVINERSVIRMGTKLYNTVPDDITEMDNYEAFKKEIISFISCILLS